MKSVIFVTKNDYKFKVAQDALKNSGIKLVQKKLEVPEIQSTEVKEIAAFSAQWASNLLKKPIVLTDAGYYIEALNGFPGPFIKFINQWLTAKDLLALMKGKENRTVITKYCLAYCAPDQKPITFSATHKGQIAYQRDAKGETPINEIFIPDGFDKPESEIPREKMIKFWNKSQAWSKLAKYLVAH